MKYGKELAEKMKVLPWHVRRCSIDYKAWKRWHCCCNGDWETMLLWDCCKCDIIATRSSEVNQMNVKTFYKVCKRLQKKYELPAMEFYVRVVKSNRFKFIGPFHDFI